MSIDKEKLIEETAKEFCPIYVDPTYEDCDLCKQGSDGNCDALKKLKKLIKNYFPKDSVVLSREEYEEYKKVADGKAIMVENITDLNRLVQFPIEYDNKKFEDIAEFGNYIQEQACKEMTEKIIAKIKQFLSNVETVVDDDKYMLYPEVGYKCSEVDDFLDKLEKEEFAKQFGVEVKES